MIADIIIGVIVLLSMITGFKNGLANTLAHTLGWIAAIICGVAFDKDAQQLLNDNTGLYDYLTDVLKEKANESLSDPAVTGEGIPDALIALRNSAADALAVNAADAAFTVIAFLLVVAGVRLITFIFCHLFSKKHNEGFIGLIDGFLGLVVGLIRGALLSLLLLSLVCPLLTVTSPDLAELIISSMDGSYVSEFLYDKNILLELVNTFKA